MCSGNSMWDSLRAQEREKRMTINYLVEESFRNSLNKGFYEGPDGCSIPAKIALIHSEASEALEDYRDGNMTLMYQFGGGTGKPEKPVGFPSELADIMIRVADLAGWLGIDLEAAIKEKMAYNATRPYKHGGKKA